MCLPVSKVYIQCPRIMLAYNKNNMSYDMTETMLSSGDNMMKRNIRHNLRSLGAYLVIRESDFLSITQINV